MQVGWFSYGVAGSADGPDFFPLPDEFTVAHLNGFQVRIIVNPPFWAENRHDVATAWGLPRRSQQVLNRPP